MRILTHHVIHVAMSSLVCHATSCIERAFRENFLLKHILGRCPSGARSPGSYLLTDLNPAPRISTPNQTALKSLSYVTNDERKNGEGTKARSFYAAPYTPPLIFRSPFFTLLPTNRTPGTGYTMNYCKIYTLSNLL